MKDESLVLYGDILFNVRCGGVVCEVQLHLRPIQLVPSFQLPPCETYFSTTAMKPVSQNQALHSIWKHQCTFTTQAWFHSEEFIPMMTDFLTSLFASVFRPLKQSSGSNADKFEENFGYKKARHFGDKFDEIHSRMHALRLIRLQVQQDRLSLSGAFSSFSSAFVFIFICAFKFIFKRFQVFILSAFKYSFVFIFKCSGTVTKLLIKKKPLIKLKFIKF